ncbi:MAG: FHA domain-containing protein [Kiritimatiellae bacterium]|nr:FHA domain-containing protein [Kiritimatiellia bacterium]
MATERMWKITIVGGSKDGNDFSFPADKTVLIGRSHYREVDAKLYVTLHLDEKHKDVSGKHLELFVKDGEAFVRNVSEHSVTLLNGTKVRLKECVRVQVGDTVTLGGTVKVRLDEIPVEHSALDDPETGGTIYVDPDMLPPASRKAMEDVSASPVEISPRTDISVGSTAVTRNSSSPDKAGNQGQKDGDVPASTASNSSVQESLVQPLTNATSAAAFTSPHRFSLRLSGPAIFGKKKRQKSETSAQSSFREDATGQKTNLTDVKRDSRTASADSSGLGMTTTKPSPVEGRYPDVPTQNNPLSGDGETVVPDSSVFERPMDDNPSVSGGGDGDKTRLFISGNPHIDSDDRPTPRPPSKDVIDAMKREMERKRRSRRILMGIVVGAVFAGAGFWWYLTRPGGEEWLTYPEPIHEFGLRDENGAMLLKVDYPWNENADVAIASGSNGVTVASAMGRDRDVPYFLHLEVRSDPDELKIDLMESISRWFNRTEESDLGFSFDERMKESVKPQFFEDVYPGSCQEKSLYGVRFVQFEYKRSRGVDAKMWHGIGIYFRCGDVVYSLLREIPETFWARGGYYFKIDSNLAIYKRFTEEYWESPGFTSVLPDKPVDELFASIRNSFAKERPSDWRVVVGQSIDSILMKNWNGDANIRDRAKEFLAQFREKLQVFYYKEYNAYQTAKTNRDEKKMGEIRQDVKSIFDNQGERYYFLIGNGEVW